MFKFLKDKLKKAVSKFSKKAEEEAFEEIEVKEKEIQLDEKAIAEEEKKIKEQEKKKEAELKKLEEKKRKEEEKRKKEEEEKKKGEEEKRKKEEERRKNEEEERLRKEAELKRLEEEQKKKEEELKKAQEEEEKIGKEAEIKRLEEERKKREEEEQELRGKEQKREEERKKEEEEKQKKEELRKQKEEERRKKEEEERRKKEEELKQLKEQEKEVKEKKSFFSRIKDKLKKKKVIEKGEVLEGEEKELVIEEVTEFEKKGFFAKVKEKVTTKKITAKQFDELFWELELAMMENNVAVEVIEKIKADLKKDLVDVPLRKSAIQAKVLDGLKKSIEGLFEISPVNLVEQVKYNEKPYVILFVGVNGSGKCMTGDTLIPLANGDFVPIKELYEDNKSKEVNYGGDSYIIEPGMDVFSLDKSLKVTIKKPIALCKLKSPKYLEEISLANGMKIIVTKEHPLLSIEDANPIWIKAENLRKGMHVAVPRVLPKKTNFNLDEEILKRLGEGFFVKVGSYEIILDYLKKKYGTLTEAYKKLNINRSFSSFVGHWKYNKLLPINIYLKLKDEINIRILGLQYGGSKPIPVPILNSNLAELVGLVIAEGHLNEKQCEITNKDTKIIDRFAQLNNNLFKIKVKPFVDSRGLIRARVGNWSVIRLLHDAFEIPFGNKSRILVIPKLILKAGNEPTKAFLRAYIESEGHIGLNNRTIEIPTSSEKAAYGLAHLFLTLGIETTLSKKVTNVGAFYRVYINGASKHEKLTEFGFYTRKNRTLKNNNNMPKQFEITNLIPKCGNYLKKLRTRHGLFRTALSEPIGCVPSMITHYEQNIPIPKQNLLQIAKTLKSEHLIKLAESEISWIKIKSVRKVKNKEKWVYDLSMENSNFIANNIISHNTTTIAKIAKMMLDNGLRPIIAASDTFRAAAIHQLEEHGKKLGVKVVKHDYGSDPSAVAFDAIKSAKAHHLDVVLIDTAGRMHSNLDLVNEMKKIVRVTNPNMKIFVAEAISGNDAVTQSRAFDEAIDIDGIILAKSDIDEKGGAIVSISYVTGKPILYLGTGQGWDDLEKFDPKNVLQKIGL